MEAKGINKCKVPTNHETYSEKPITSLKAVSTHKAEENSYSQHNSNKIPPKKS
jgi:hypothetical protein